MNPLTIARYEFRAGAEDCQAGKPCDSQNAHPEYVRGYAMQYEVDNTPAELVAAKRDHIKELLRI